MPSSKQMIKNAKLSLTHAKIHDFAPPDLNEIVAAYPPTSEIKKDDDRGGIIIYQCGETEIRHRDRWDYSLTHHTCGFCIIGKRYIGKKDGKYYYEWRGDSLLVSDRLLPLETIAEINRVKEEELKRQTESRFNKIEKPIDAVRIILRELGYTASLSDNALRIYTTGACHVSFLMKDQYDVVVRFGYYNGGSGGPIHREIDKLNLADPQFNDKVARIMSNATNILDIIAGRVKPAE